MTNRAGLNHTRLKRSAASLRHAVAQSTLASLVEKVCAAHLSRAPVELLAVGTEASTV